MTNRNKWILAVALLLVGACLIGWNLRDPDRAYREVRIPDEAVTLEQVPPPVRSTIKREGAGGELRELVRENEQGTITYEVEIAVGGRKLELDVAEDGSIVKRELKKLKAKKS
jgi:hypothetical protein